MGHVGIKENEQNYNGFDRQLREQIINELNGKMMMAKIIKEPEP